MNILYVSKLSGNLFAGPNHSVPAQIKAQTKKDSVMWYNLNHVKRNEWTQDGLYCKNMSDFPTGRLQNLPQPFNRPDLVVFEELYCYPFCKLLKAVQKNKIPYIVVPRSELTKQAQTKKAWKKKIGNFVYFRKMVKKAAAIQYLSQQEYLDSGDKWNQNRMIIPNGIDEKKIHRGEFSEGEIRAVYIGRYEKYQKGLDILLDAVAKKQKLLREANFRLQMYGVEQEGAIAMMQQQIKENGISDLISVADAIYGQEKESVLLSADVFIMTSRFEGMPMGMIEALSYGIPCLATTGTNLTDEIEQYRAGWTAETTVASVANSLETMVLEYAEIQEKGKNAQRLAKTFAWDNIAEKSHEEYMKVIGR